MIVRNLVLFGVLALLPGIALAGSVEKPPKEIRQLAKSRLARLKESDDWDTFKNAFKAIGDLESFYSSGAWRFTFEYEEENGTIWRTENLVDPIRRKVYQTVTEPYEGVLVWDGNHAWTTSQEKLPVFYWAQIPWALMAAPYLAGEPGAVTSWAMDDSPAMDFSVSETTRVSFSSMFGPWPLASALIYFDGKSYLPRAMRIADSPDARMGKGKRTPERLVTCSNFEPHGGLRVPTAFTIYRIEGETRGVQLGTARVVRLETNVPFPTELLQPPPGAREDRTHKR